MNDDFTKYYNIKTRREKHINLTNIELAYN